MRITYYLKTIIAITIFTNFFYFSISAEGKKNLIMSDFIKNFNEKSKSLNCELILNENFNLIDENDYNQLYSLNSNQPYFFEILIDKKIEKIISIKIFFQEDFSFNCKFNNLMLLGTLLTLYFPDISSNDRGKIVSEDLGYNKLFNGKYIKNNIEFKLNKISYTIIFLEIKFN